MSILEFSLNVAAALVLCLSFQWYFLDLIPGFSRELLLGWSLSEFLGLFAALYLLNRTRRHIPILRLREAGR